MNICIFNGDMSRGGGTERITQILGNLLINYREFDVTILNLNNKKKISYYPLDQNVHFETLPAGSLLSKVFYLVRFLRTHHIDIIIDVDVMLGIVSFPAAFFCPNVKIVSWEMFNFNNDIGNRYTHLMRKIAVLFGAYYVTQTIRDKEVFMENLHIRCPIKHIYNPCAVDASYTGYNRNSKTIITAGHFFFTKGYDLAVKVAQHVFLKHPDWRWEFYGDGIQEDKIRQSIADNGLQNNVVICGRTSSMEDVYKNASMYVMTSRTEGFGLVLTEAKSYNLPTIAFDVDFGPREIIQNNLSGYLIPPFDTELMAAKICELIENEEKRIMFSSCARSNLYKFSDETFCAEWLNLLRSLK